MKFQNSNMETVHVYYDYYEISDDRSSLVLGQINYNEISNKPLMLSGYYGTGYHVNPIKVGDKVKLVFSDTEEIARVISIRMQYWNGDNDHDTNPSLDKYILKETIPSHKNWLRVEFLPEERNSKLNQLGL